MYLWNISGSYKFGCKSSFTFFWRGLCWPFLIFISNRLFCTSGPGFLLATCGRFANICPSVITAMFQTWARFVLRPKCSNLSVKAKLPTWLSDGCGDRRWSLQQIVGLPEVLEVIKQMPAGINSARRWVKWQRSGERMSGKVQLVIHWGKKKSWRVCV